MGSHGWMEIAAEQRRAHAATSAIISKPGGASRGDMPDLYAGLALELSLIQDLHAYNAVVATLSNETKRTRSTTRLAGSLDDALDQNAKLITAYSAAFFKNAAICMDLETAFQEA